jgi:hypothetical protein
MSDKDNDLIRRGEAVEMLLAMRGPVDVPRTEKAVWLDEGIDRCIEELRALPAALDVQPAPDAAVKPTDAQVASACLSYRHDFGLLNAEERQKVMFQAREWLHAWQKELDLTLRPAPDAAPLSPTAVDARPAPVDPKVAALVEAARNLCEQFALENPMQTGGRHGEMCQCRRCRMDQLRVALAAWERRGNE